MSVASVMPTHWHLNKLHIRSFISKWTYITSTPSHLPTFLCIVVEECDVSWMLVMCQWPCTSPRSPTNNNNKHITLAWPYCPRYPLPCKTYHTKSRGIALYTKWKLCDASFTHFATIHTSQTDKWQTTPYNTWAKICNKISMFSCKKYMAGKKSKNIKTTREEW